MHLDVKKIRDRLSQVNGVAEVHDVHIWSISNDKYSFTCHVTLKPGYDGHQQRVLKELDNICRKEYELNHNCIQIEISDEPDSFLCGNDIHH